MFRYFGSKSSTAAFVADIALDNFQAATVADAFGGLGNMGVEFRRRGCKVTTCDLLSFPIAFQFSRINCSRTPSFEMVISQLGLKSTDDLALFLNNLRPASDWFVREYSERRQFFTKENALRIGGAWGEISRWDRKGWLPPMERKYAIASLLNSLDRCANTAGTYYAYLKTWHRKALRPFGFEWLPTETKEVQGQALQGDSLVSLSGKSYDLLYLDPPYNSRDYSRYYHLPETLAGLKAIKVDSTSKSGQPVERPVHGAAIRAAMGMPYLEQLITNVEWRRLVLQYAGGAHISLPDLRNLLSQFGGLVEHKIPALGYRTTKGPRANTHHVFVVNK